MPGARKIVVYGGHGCLGSYCISRLKLSHWWVGSVDYLKNKEADHNVIIEDGSSWLDQEKQVFRDMGAVLKTGELDAILCFAGGFTGGNAEKNLSKQTEIMWKQSVWGSTIAASLATKYLAPDGMLVFTGARSALYGTPKMIGYGMAKAAVHHLTKSLGSRHSVLPKNSLVVAILPDILNTKQNRTLMPFSSCNSWTPLGFVYDLIEKWLQGKERPPNGSLLAVITADNVSRVTKMQEDVDPSVVM